MWLNRNEWDRLKSQTSMPQEPHVEENTCLKHIIPQSQELGLIELQKRKNKDDFREFAEVKALVKQKRHDDRQQAIAKARQLIFEGSSYGKQLLSALIASKVIEEREAQIAFKKEIKKKEMELEKETNREVLYFCKSDQRDLEKQRKKKNVMFAEENKCMYETRKAIVKKHKEEEASFKREDAVQMQKLLDSEKREQKRVIKFQEEEIIEYHKEQQEFRKAKMKREIENDEKIEKVRKEDEYKLLKIKRLQQQFIKEKLESDVAEMNYKLIEKIENEKRKRFEDFVEIGIKRHEDEAMKKEQEEILKQQREQEEKKILRKQQQIAMEELKLSRRDMNYCACDRQCVLSKSKGARGKDQKKLPLNQPDPKSLDKKLQFLSSQKNLIEELKLRKKEPSPWTGLNGNHAQFAQEAERTLADCKHKAMARKVVDEYRRLNFLDATTLPVKNY